MIVVAYLYNCNGMATWCWEAAHSLSEAGQQVMLICRPGVPLPDIGEVKIFKFEPPASRFAKGTFGRAIGLINGLSSRPQTFLRPLHETLVARGIVPTAYLLNQTDLYSPDVPVRQYVVAWANPPTFAGYLISTGAHSGWWPSKRLLRTAVGCIGWYRKDWRGYRNASGVLAVSHRLAAAIRRGGVRADVVHPGTAVPPAAIEARVRSACTPVRLMIVAADLSDSRKRVRWILEALRRSPPAQPVTLTLVGEASEALRASVNDLPLSVEFTGLLQRPAIVEVYRNHDVILFASVLDDWGYVLIEAMAAGLNPIVPDQSPFDEIVDGGVGRRFRPGSMNDLTTCLTDLVNGLTPASRMAAASRARMLFSRPVFAEHLMRTISNTGPTQGYL